VDVFLGAPRMPVSTHVDASPAQRRVVHMAMSLLLDYPDGQLTHSIAAVRHDRILMPAAVADEIIAFCDVAESWGLRALQEHYVETFDQRRRCALYLSYYSAGDTRERGAAILGFRDVMRNAGFEMNHANELPDYLPVVLEFSARATEGDTLLRANREALEIIRSALVAASSPYAHLLEGLCLVLSPLDERTLGRYQKLISQGPPVEMVGLAAMDSVSTPRRQS
jgi:nitrate reductase delta subunit